MICVFSPLLFSIKKPQARTRSPCIPLGRLSPWQRGRLWQGTFFRPPAAFVLMYCVYLFMAVLDLHDYAQAFTSCDALASCCGGFSRCRAQAPGAGFISCGTWAQQLWYMSLVASRHVGSFQISDGTCVPALADRFLTTGPSGKPSLFLLDSCTMGKV